MTLTIAVIGAGINGLVAAHYLRRAGHRVTLLDRADRPGGACVSAETIIDGVSQRYALGASVLGLMPDFIFTETGLADRLETFVPGGSKRVYFPTEEAGAWIHRDPARLDAEFRHRWGERGDIEAFRHDEAAVVRFLQAGYRAGTPPTLDAARAALGEALTKLWITGSAADLLDHYCTAERTKIYFAMTVTESGPVSLHEPYSAFTIPLMDSGSVFDGYYGFVKPGLWRLTETLADINAALGVESLLGAVVDAADPERASLQYRHAGATRRGHFDQLVFATDPVSAARIVGDQALIEKTTATRNLGSSGKLTLMFRNPVRWKDAPHADRDAAFRFIFATETLSEFERATRAVVTDGVAYQPGYIQIYCEGAAMRGLGLAEPFDRLTLFFKNLALGAEGAELGQVQTEVTNAVLSRIANPGDCVWGRLLSPRDLQRLFLFPGGNLDHTELVGGQTFGDRQFAAEPDRRFYQFGSWPKLWYCGAGSYPCGSIAGTPGYLCARELLRSQA